MINKNISKQKKQEFIKNRIYKRYRLKTKGETKTKRVNKIQTKNIIITDKENNEIKLEQKLEKSDKQKTKKKYILND